MCSHTVYDRPDYLMVKLAEATWLRRIKVLSQHNAVQQLLRQPPRGLCSTPCEIASLTAKQPQQKKRVAAIGRNGDVGPDRF